MTDSTVSPTSDERALAALAHFFGPLISILIWTTQKDKSRFVRFQAAQAMAFDALWIVLFGAGIGCSMLLVLGGVMAGALANRNADSAINNWLFLPAAFPFVIWLPLLPCGMVTWIIRIIAAVSAFQGQPFQYPWLGKRVAEFLGEQI